MATKPKEASKKLRSNKQEKKEKQTKSKEKIKDKEQKKTEDTRKRRKKKKRRPLRRIFPIILRVLFIVALCVGALILGAMFGYGILGEGEPKDILEKETWQHIIDIVTKE